MILALQFPVKILIYLLWKCHTSLLWLLSPLLCQDNDAATILFSILLHDIFLLVVVPCHLLLSAFTVVVSLHYNGSVLPIIAIAICCLLIGCFIINSLSQLAVALMLFFHSKFLRLSQHDHPSEHGRCCCVSIPCRITKLVLLFPPIGITAADCWITFDTITCAVGNSCCKYPTVHWAWHCLSNCNAMLGMLLPAIQLWPVNVYYHWCYCNSWLLCCKQHHQHVWPCWYCFHL